MKTKFLLLMSLCATFSLAVAQDAFEGRPSSAGPDVANSKENIPAKKESFTAKLERYNNEGFKVAVVLHLGAIHTLAPSPGSANTLIKTLTLKGKILMNSDDCMGLLESYTLAMNEAFNTDIFEIVDMKTIPYKEVKVGKVSDWATTKYKMVISYYVNPSYDYQLAGDNYSARFVVGISAGAVEYVNDKKGIKMKYPIRGGDLGAYILQYNESSNLKGLSTIEELHDIVSPASGAELISELQKAQDEKMSNYLEKRKKK